MLESCPTAGNGVNQWLYATGRQLHAHMDEQSMLALLSIRAGDHSDDEIATALEPVLHGLAQAVKQHTADRKTLIFLPLIETSYRLAEILRGYGLSAEAICGESPDRKTEQKGEPGLKEAAAELSQQLLQHEGNLPALCYQAYQLVSEFLSSGKEQAIGWARCTRIRAYKNRLVEHSVNSRRDLTLF
jgi:hypothetical protein